MDLLELEAVEVIFVQELSFQMSHILRPLVSGMGSFSQGMILLSQDKVLRFLFNCTNLG